MELKNKVITFFGDSITEGVGVVNLENRFDNRIKRKYELKEAYNMGISGTRIAHQSNPSEEPRFDLCMCGRAYDINPESDIIVFYGGVNDYFHGDAYFGDMSDKTPKTFCGGVEFVMNLLNNKYPNAKKVFITPARFADKDFTYEEVSTNELKAPDAKPLKAYCDVIIKKAKEKNIDVIDFYDVLPFKVEGSDDYKKFTSDGLHFNDAGHEILANIIGEFLSNL